MQSDLNKVSLRRRNLSHQAYELVQMTFLLNGRAVDALALIVHKASQDAVGRTWVKKLRGFNQLIYMHKLTLF